DGAQQSIVAVGMRLRSIQRRLPSDAAAREELDGAVEALEHTVAELRRIAHGVRPSRLDDGLTVALRALSVVTPVPLDVHVCELPTDGGKNDTLVTTAYFVVAEAVANAWKHAQADHVVVRVEEIEGTDGTGLRVEVCDDGVGGVEPSTSLIALRDRVASVGGRLDVVSPVGGGTRVTALL
ncbi:MAG: histidine kinase, partial [Actinomycetota bacterium]|nr:histidine kinase [Actinomycetota bacterium]